MSSYGGGDDPLTTIGKRAGKHFKDLGYALGSGNFNSYGQSLFGGEGTVDRKQREEEEKQAADTAQAQADADSAYDRSIRSRIDKVGQQRKALPGSAATLLSQNYGQGSRGTLLTPGGV